MLLFVTQCFDWSERGCAVGGIDAEEESDGDADAEREQHRVQLDDRLDADDLEEAADEAGGDADDADEDLASTMIWSRPLVTPVIRSCVVVSGAIAMSSWSWTPFVPFGVSTPTTVKPMPLSLTVWPSGLWPPNRFSTTVWPRTTTRA